MNRQDLKKTCKSYYNAADRPEIVEFGIVQYISITGKGDPAGEEFAAHIQALYPVAYKLKFDAKAKGNDFIVPKLEALWWYDEQQYSGISISDAPLKIPRSEWEYRLLIRLPEQITASEVNTAVEAVFAKKQQELIKAVSFFELKEGKCVQVMHKGPFDQEPETLQILNDFTTRHDLKKNGLHHEIYLSDFRKTSPEKLKTILREPVK
ncbi:GyrI-like domain-containing protein [Dyadobacter crusticola]|uniref:GyrI-like domain-containing protein n=1 Tax=Dyadobacter crusticola TaxID=292407 RepID=UPI0004E12FC4|nr:GyrI-like domain-containing protein [Dyadobacter crusticola]